MSERYILREQEFHTGVPLPDGCKDMEAGEGYVLLVKAKDHDAELQALRDEVKRLRGALEQAGDDICSEFCGAGPCHKKCMAVQAALTQGKGGEGQDEMVHV